MKEQAKNLYLIGFPSVGKTTIGSRLAERLSFPFFDLDICLQERYKMTIKEMFATYGEPWFRKQEQAMLRERSLESGAVIATGGGVIMNPDNWAIMEEHGTVVLLDIDFEKIYERLQAHEITKRPLFCGKTKEQIKELYDLRKDIYHRASLIVQTDDLDIGAVTDKVENAVRSL